MSSAAYHLVEADIASAEIESRTRATPLRRAGQGEDMDRKQQILDAAERRVCARGFDGFSYGDLEAEIGIRKASIHHHFPSKADLGLALTARYRRQVMDKLDAIAARRTRAADRLAEYLDLYRQALAGGAQLCLCVALSAGRDSLNSHTLAELDAFNEASLQWLTGLFTLAAEDGSIEDVGEPGLEAAAALALVEGAQLIARAAGDMLKFDLATAQLKARIKLV